MDDDDQKLYNCDEIHVISLAKLSCHHLRPLLTLFMSEIAGFYKFYATSKTIMFSTFKPLQWFYTLCDPCLRTMRTMRALCNLSWSIS